MNKIQLFDKGIHITCERTDNLSQVLAPFYPFHSNRLHTDFWLSPHTAPEVLNILRGISISNLNTFPQAIQNIVNKELYRRQNLQDLFKNGPKESCRVNDNLTLKRHQQLGREIAQIQDRYGFFYDTRTGKTPMSLAIILDDLHKYPKHKWLVLCPLILIENAWLEDAAHFVPEIKTVNCWAPTRAARLKTINANATSGQLFISNTESFINYRQFLEPLNFTGVFIDESSDMKSPKSKVSKDLVDFAQHVSRFYLLSGTPAPNCESEYYMQMRAIDFYGWHQSYNQFKNDYFVNLSFNPAYEKLALKPDRKDTLFDKIKQYAIFIDKEDVLNTPGREFHPVMLNMPVELKKYYTSMKNDLYIKVNEERNILAPSVAAKLNKLNQITSGFVMDTEVHNKNELFGTTDKDWYLLSRYRFDALDNLLKSDTFKDEQVIIWANYKHEFELIKDMYKSDCACIYGATSIMDKNTAIAAFKAGKLKYLVANPASADKGLTLTNCHLCIYFSLGYSYEHYKQSTERIYADKSIQPKHCDYYILMAKGTIDKIIYSEVLAGKQDASYAILNHLKPGGS